MSSPRLDQGEWFSTMQAQLSPEQEAELQLLQLEQEYQQAYNPSSSYYEYQQFQRNCSSATAAETNGYIAQYELVAEAAKRAQIACLERDLDAMEF
jgi:hypothetical protein